MGLQYVDFTSRVVQDGTHDVMELYVEPKEKIDEAALTKRINEKLAEVDRDWRDLQSFLKYTPLRLKILPRGSFKAYLASQKGMPRVERIGMSEERFRTLINKVS